VLRVQTERFQTLCESAPFGMVMISKDGDFTYVNPKSRRFSLRIGRIAQRQGMVPKAFLIPGTGTR